jgi:hypothetical protein
MAPDIAAMITAGHAEPLEAAALAPSGVAA